MATNSTSSIQTLVRSIALGVLLSMIATYLLHVFGEWRVENYRPDEETTDSVMLYNKCAGFGSTHTLQPNSSVSSVGDIIDGTKLAASFMNFFDGHVVAMIIIALVLGGVFFFLRRRGKKKQQ